MRDKLTVNRAMKVGGNEIRHSALVEANYKSSTKLQNMCYERKLHRMWSVCY